MFAKLQTRAPRYMPIKSFFLAIGWLSAISITTTTKVLKLLGKLSPNKATGLDNISCRLLKEAGPIIATSLSLNVTKTEYMFLTTTVKLSNLGRDFPIKIGNNHVKRVQTTKYLGIHLDENLK